MGKVGSHSFSLDNAPLISASACYVGDKEGKGPMREYFDKICRDDTLGLDSWEQAESKMFESAVRVALAKIEKKPTDLDCLLGGDLLNQIISSGYAARELKAPFLGLYGACSTITESLLVGSMIISGEFANIVACAASSHFSSAERQYRYPLEMGTQSTPTSQRTVTGAGCVILRNTNAMQPNEKTHFKNIRLMGGTIGRVIDMGITDANNMGAAMAPAAADTICASLADFGRTAQDYDCIVTGDLGTFGSELLHELCKERGVDIESNHLDCGSMMFDETQNTVCGGSGCGCAATILSGYFLPMLEAGKYSRILFLATGALMSPISNLQGESIPGIAHAVIIERS